MRGIAKVNLQKAREEQGVTRDERGVHLYWEQTVYLRKRKGWKFRRKWIDPFEAICRLGVDYKLRSDKGKVMGVHHDRSKIGYAPVNSGNVVDPARGVGSDRVIYTVPTNNVQPHCDNAPLNIPRVRPRNLRQIIRSPDRYGNVAPS